MQASSIITTAFSLIGMAVCLYMLYQEVYKPSFVGGIFGVLFGGIGMGLYIGRINNYDLGWTTFRKVVVGIYIAWTLFALICVIVCKLRERQFNRMYARRKELEKQMGVDIGADEEELF